MRLAGLSRQIALSMAMMAFCVTVLVVVTGFTFYYVAMTYWPVHFESPGWKMTMPEWVWLLSSTVAGLALSVVMGLRLARRILVPLNSVAEGIRRVAQGDLDARAAAGDRSLREAAALADDFNALASQLQRMTKEQAFWNAAIAHELRTPVTVLRGRLQGLAEGVFTPDETQFRRLLAQVEGLAHLIEDLRVISLEESGHLDIEVRDTDLAAEVRAVVEVFEDALLAAGLQAVLDLDERPAHCDPVRIRQALLALLDNARRYAQPGLVRVQLSMEDGLCRLRVEDEGPGISEDFAPHAFEAFRRADAARQSGKGGSGLGLAVVAAIARAHGGEARCSPTGGGSRFELSWPQPGRPSP
ncbi:signal transduction histidine kinase [Chromobacterium alkanivorans]|uniref:ATP-binding protein n=1 Tax=Chromobacterium alkanivorans TaxID=1071719 RepID=UPI002168CD0A|nr:ATP-binding protein [Chromobacterium alkanivorans]MCS3802832.1 signal transduction histidine kinase [Chromobacterium alkanivorans]MCS3817158.1 signal transduction histidine kinase [Chromobacterium alkanivorans]MCS3872198.1 signal transduction histidine kinase [Chromobacterium alkanivorans]